MYQTVRGETSPRERSANAIIREHFLAPSKFVLGGATRPQSLGFDLWFELGEPPRHEVPVTLNRQPQDASDSL
jgi:hypothetical protein